MGWLWECLGESFRSLDTGQWDDVIKGDASLGAGPAIEYNASPLPCSDSYIQNSLRVGLTCFSGNVS